jgi:formylglycine-generating enzyme required for sulfatase activity
MNSTPCFGAFSLVLLTVVIGNTIASNARAELEPTITLGTSQIGKGFAIIIGIDQYERAPLLKYAVADAKALEDLLVQQGFEVTALYNERATRQTILKELGDKLVRSVGETDRVVVFFAGHGETYKAKGGSRMGYLLPVEAEPTLLSSTAISMGTIKELADAIPAKHILFLMDACYGGIAGIGFRGIPSTGPDYLLQITKERGRQLITAGGADQQVLESSELSHSVFTHFLIQGLENGLADLNQDGIVPASELYSYLDSRVFTAAKLKGYNQRPEMWALSAEKGEFVFVATNRTGSPNRASSSEKDERQVIIAALVQAEEELRRLEGQEQLLRETRKLEKLRKQIDERRTRLERTVRRSSDPPPPMSMALVPAGEFTMGSYEHDNESPPHQVTLGAFRIDRYEVTTRHYAEFLDAVRRDPILIWDEVDWKTDFNRPVIGVTWYDADAYCRWAGKRLPSEAEWEKAARGTDARRFPWGNGSPTPDYANYGKCCEWKGYSTLTAIGSYGVGESPYGVHDMAGNVWEWVEDWYDANYYKASPTQDPNGPSTGEQKVVRGGSWGDQWSVVSSSVRNKVNPTLRHTDIGFRCVEDVSP